MHDKSINSYKDLLDIEAVALLLNISKATVRNWVKCGHLPLFQRNTKGYFFYKEDIENIKQKILTGKLNKLNKRVNKIKSHKTFVPSEYAPGVFNQDKLNNIIFFIKENNINVSEALFLLSLNFLKTKNVLSSVKISDLLQRKKLCFFNPQIRKEVFSWLSTINQKNIKTHYSFLLDCDLPDQKDCLGFLYQSLLFEGEKSYSGSYYTPSDVVYDMIKPYVKPDSRVLDPCSGTGQFLLAFSDKVQNPLNIYGIDCDEIAVKIARLNLLTKFKNKNFVPNIFCKNTLFDSQVLRDYLKTSPGFAQDPFHQILKHKLSKSANLFNGRNCYDKGMKNFDIIATNPPWGARFSKTETKILQNIYPEISSAESFSYFLNKSLGWLKNNGVASFILPEAFLNVRTHKDIRKIILTKTRIINITYLGRIFKNIFTPVIKIDLKKESQKTKVKKTHLTSVYIPKKKYCLSQMKWLETPDFIFNIHANPYDRKIIDEVYKVKHITLKKRANWALGIVTGDNKKFISDNKKPGFEPIYTGKEVKKFLLDEPSRYIKFQPDKFQQMAHLEKYRVREKLIYRFISKYLIFAYDNKKRLTLNSANILIPEISDYPIKVIVALFNSSLYQFVFQKKFSSIKVLRSHIESLPLPLWDKNVFSKIKKSVDKVMQNQSKFQELDDYIMDQFSFTKNQKNYILSEVSGRKYQVSNGKTQEVFTKRSQGKQILFLRACQGF